MKERERGRERRRVTERMRDRETESNELKRACRLLKRQRKSSSTYLRL